MIMTVMDFAQEVDKMVAPVVYATLREEHECPPRVADVLDASLWDDEDDRNYWMSGRLMRFLYRHGYVAFRDAYGPLDGETGVFVPQPKLWEVLG